MELELKQVAPDEPVVAELVGAPRAEIDARNAHADPVAGKARRPIADAVRGYTDLVVAYACSEAAGLRHCANSAPGVGEIKRMYVVPEHTTV